MNFLEICQRARSEAGIPGTGPSSVVAQTGQLLRVVQWVSEAYEEIQNLHPTWRFLQKSFDFSTIIGTATYTPTGVALSDFGKWKTNDFRVYLTESDETFLVFEPWETFRSYYNFGAFRSQTGRPIVITVKPDDSLMTYPISEQVYTIDGQYYRSAHIMTANADEPLFATQFHMAIVWKALMLYSGDLGAADLYAHAQLEYKKLSNKMRFKYLPKVTFGRPLA
ncbi:MAG: hypothetical protein H8D87_04820 [Deltaproteobacteria bacterium]|nr:hypothetical protein [Candidatus Desulfobacula maris]